MTVPLNLIAPRCQRCGHPDHTHPDGNACAATDVTGPASLAGRPTLDGYEHLGRDAIACSCEGLR